jgi:pyridoxamine 5'-phosphate oxidase
VELDDLDPDPHVQFARWLEDAGSSGLRYPETAALATATANGVPSVRMVLLKGHDARGFAFFTNLESRKARELSASPHAALALHWETLARQVRIEGTVERVPDLDAQTDFSMRPRGSRISAWASPQSRTVADRTELERLVETIETRFESDDDLPLPPHWGGYRVVPTVIEFWHGRDDRLHDRIRYDRGAAGWSRHRLAP